MIFELLGAFWLSWVYIPLLVFLLHPIMIAGLLYVTALILYLYKVLVMARGGSWYPVKILLSFIWGLHSWLWHGYEVRGVENFPKEGGALMVYYHGAIPVDVYYLLATLMQKRARLFHLIADRFLFKVPGFSIIAEVFNISPGSPESCTNILKQGNLLAIAPGGVYESQFSHHYQLLWKSRVGFAKVALEAQVPIIPIFTENIREAYRTMSTGRWLFEKIYDWVKFPAAPVYGGFPVKMITHIGEPIPYDASLTPEDLKRKVAGALSDLIRQHQRIPGSIADAALDRVFDSKVESWKKSEKLKKRHG